MSKFKITHCNCDYSIEIDSVEESRWGALLLEFDDANIHQTWSEGKTERSGKNLSHLILKRCGQVAAMAQISIRRLPAFRTGVATVYWGPLWRRKNEAADYADLYKMMEVLKEVYVDKKGLLLRIWPVGFQHTEEKTASLIEESGFIRNTNVARYNTLVLDLLPPLDELMKNLDQKWRNKLRFAEKSNLSIMVGSSDDMYSIFSNMLNEMLLRKKFLQRVDYGRYTRIQSDLPEFLKMKIFICTCEGVPVSAAVISAIGETGTYMLGATADIGLKYSGSYLIHWEVIKWLKARGCKWYDLGGIDKFGNPGVYSFKRGIAGKSGREAISLGQFFLVKNPIGSLLNIGINNINKVQDKLRNISKVFG